MAENAILDGIRFPEDLKALPEERLEPLCAEIREFLIDRVSKTGGHLASNLGAVELTVGLHRVFDCPVDQILFDVGHQSYVHKILTGRKDRFDTLRQLDGLSGFQRPDESPYDAFVSGHASNSISTALGMARARTLEGRHNEVVCVIGDGAMTGGMAYEGLNDAGQSGEKLIVVFNDNEMSISKNVGAFAKRLSHMRSKPRYLNLKTSTKRILSRLPKGDAIIRFVSNVKAKLRMAILKESIFEILGFRYLGPVDGNNVRSVITLLEEAKSTPGPVVVHFKTVKGRGYYPSESSPWDYHGVSPFDPVTGKGAPKGSTFSDVLGAELTQLAGDDDRICAVTAAMEDGTGLKEFSGRYPSRFFDVGIAEGHAVTMAAGMAAQGMKPVFAVYSSFLQRGYDQLIHDVAIASNHVVFAVDRAGLVGADGETHQGVFDVPYLLSVPGIKVLAPASFEELRHALRQALYNEKGPVAVRFPRGGELAYKENAFTAGQTVLRSGTDLTLAGYGIMINNLLEAADLLAQKGVSAEVVKLNELTDPDLSVLFDSCARTGRLVVAEDCCSGGCLGERIAARLLACGLVPALQLVNLGEQFIPHGKVNELYQRYGVDPQGIADRAMEIMDND